MFKIRRFIMIMAAAAAMGAVIFLTSSLLGQAASNSVPHTRLGLVSQSILIAYFTPPGCAGMGLTNIIDCTGIPKCSGTTKNDLMLGDAASTELTGGTGNDCIVAGGGNDKVDGQTGTNICIEGPGVDSYKNCTVVTP